MTSSWSLILQLFITEFYNIFLVSSQCLHTRNTRGKAAQCRSLFPYQCLLPAYLNSDYIKESLHQAFKRPIRTIWSFSKNNALLGRKCIWWFIGDSRWSRYNVLNVWWVLMLQLIQIRRAKCCKVHASFNRRYAAYSMPPGGVHISTVWRLKPNIVSVLRCRISENTTLLH